MFRGKNIIIKRRKYYGEILSGIYFTGFSFGLNSMYAVRIDGEFSKVDARSESGTKAHHVTLKDALKGASKEEIKSVEQGKK